MSQLICDSCERRVSGAGVSNYGCAMFGKAWCGGTMREQKPAPKPQRLSLEECVYWLVVAGNESHALERIAHRDAREVRAVARDRLRSSRYFKKHFETAQSIERCDFYSEIWRKRVTVARLLLEAAKRIREEKR